MRVSNLIRTITFLLAIHLLMGPLAPLVAADLKSWDEITRSLTQEPLKLPLAKPRVVIFKKERQLLLYDGDRLVREYRVGLGFNPMEDKLREGDGATPEGEFYIYTKNNKSSYYLSLGLSYPNSEDAKRGLHDGLITKTQYHQILEAIRHKGAPLQNTPLGGQIYIHGEGSGRDWTLGCIALDNKDMKELFQAVPQGNSVTIKKTRIKGK
jgi:murein L,D-transpeptidase YafK